MNKKRILIVDDEESLGRTLKLNLEVTGHYDVRVEHKGSQGLSAAHAFKPDLILLDIIMPDLEGSEVARQIRADGALHGTPIVFLTATVTKEEVGAAGGVVGGEAFLAKPVNVKQLIECIEKNIH
ncbi:MAG: response regulator [Candidatus Omnitrophica bacterium]|nr:response regulator [Candidatus Omnitrophota bacterium]